MSNAASLILPPAPPTDTVNTSVKRQAPTNGGDRPDRSGAAEDTSFEQSLARETRREEPTDPAPRKEVRQVEKGQDTVEAVDQEIAPPVKQESAPTIEAADVLPDEAPIQQAFSVRPAETPAQAEPTDLQVSIPIKIESRSEPTIEPEIELASETVPSESLPPQDLTLETIFAFEQVLADLPEDEAVLAQPTLAQPVAEQPALGVSPDTANIVMASTSNADALIAPGSFAKLYAELAQANGQSATLTQPAAGQLRSIMTGAASQPAMTAVPGTASDASEGNAPTPVVTGPIAPAAASDDGIPATLIETVSGTGGRQAPADAMNAAGLNTDAPAGRQTFAEAMNANATRSGTPGTFDVSIANTVSQIASTASGAPEIAQPSQQLQMPGPTMTGAATQIASAAPQTTAGQAVPMTALAVEIHRQASQGRTQFDIRLDPPELGALTVRLQVDAAGKAKAHLVVERAETLEMLTTDARSLERALNQAGLKTEQGGVSFELASDGSGSDSQSFENAGSEGNADQTADAPDDTAASTSTLQLDESAGLSALDVARLQIAATGQLDVRI